MFSSQNSQVSADFNYIEDVFSTWLYTGNGSTQTITNNIDLAGKGGLVWGKSRSNAYDNFLADSVRGSSKLLYSNNTYAQQTDANVFTAFNSNGFSLGVGGAVSSNTNGATYASWTFREQPKFFDIVTWTGDDTDNRAISHNLGSVPGCIITKSTTHVTNWNTYHRSLPLHYAIKLNTTAAATDLGSTGWGTTGTPTDTVFYVNTLANSAGLTYVAYLFAHDAGGFGLTGTDNVISCGTFTTDGSGVATVNLGWEPQWILYKASSATQNWEVYDTMRGITASAGTAARLAPNLSDVEADFTNGRTTINATGFSVVNLTSTTYIYIAIRRPMKVPTLGTSVFFPSATTAATGTVITTGFPVDAQIIQYRTPSGGNVLWQDRLRRVNTTDTETNNPILISNNSGAELSTFSTTRYWNNTGYQISASLANQNRIYWNLRRAPNFFDEVCYTGTGSARTVAHNLAAVPELMIIKCRNTDPGAQSWIVYPPVNDPSQVLFLNTTGPLATNSIYFGTAPTASVFTLGGGAGTNNDATGTYVAYLFATCLGVSKVGRYTGNGSSQTIACGFTSGARFVMIKRTDTDGDWYIWDSARGIVSGNDPHLSINTTAAEVTTDDTIDPNNSGFIVNQVAATDVNVSSATYIFLAIA